MEAKPAEPASMSGTLACARRDSLIELAGREAVDGALGTLAQEQPETMVDAVPIGWVPILTVEALFSETASATLADDQVIQATVAMGPEHDQLGVAPLGVVEDSLGRHALDHQAPRCRS